MSIDRSVLIYCDAPDRLCRSEFSYGTTNLRKTREAASAEGWRTGLKESDSDYCPGHAFLDWIDS